MHIDLTGRRALVTGSTAGIGFAAARALAATGASLVLSGRDADRLDRALATIRDTVPGVDVDGVAADLGTAAGCQTLIDAHPDVDVLVNNVGIFEPQPFAEIPDEEWQRFFDVNVMSGVRLTRHHIPRMAERGWGRVLFISSESAQQIPPEMVHYGATKTAQVAIARGIAESYPASGVTVNSILPGPTRSDGIVDFMGRLAAEQGIPRERFEAEFIATARPTSVIGRLCDPDEVAAMIVFVCSEQASAVTGAALRVDGGVDRAIF